MTAEEDLRPDRRIQHLGQGNLGLEHRDLSTGIRPRCPCCGTGKAAVLLDLAARSRMTVVEAVVYLLHRGDVIEIGESVIQRRELISARSATPFRVPVAGSEGQPRARRKYPDNFRKKVAAQASWQ